MPRIGFDLQDNLSEVANQDEFLLGERAEVSSMPTKRGRFPHLKLLAAQVPGQEEMSRWSQHGTNLLAKDASSHTQAHPCRLPLADRPEADRPTPIQLR